MTIRSLKRMSFVQPEAESILRDSSNIVHAIILDSIDSTDALARNIIAEAAREDQPLAPTLILAKSQRKGRGRRGHSWVSPEGGLYLNYIRSGFSPEELKYLSLGVAVALCRVLESLGPIHPRIKWPNDIFLEGAKLAGFLCYVLRAEESYGSIGLGMNLRRAPELGPEAPYEARALRAAIPEAKLDPQPLSIAFVEALESALKDLSLTHDAWRSRLLHRPGEKIRGFLENGEAFVGEYQGVDQDGCLLLQTETGLRKLSSGEVF